MVDATFNQDVKALVPAPDIHPRYLARCLRWLEPRVLAGTEESSHGTEEASRPGVREPSDSFGAASSSAASPTSSTRPTPSGGSGRRPSPSPRSSCARRSWRWSGPRPTATRRGRKWSFKSFAAPGPGAMRTGPFGSDLRHSEFVDAGVAVLGIDNAVRNRFAWDERRYITKEKYERLKRYTVQPHDVIVTIMGTTGRSAVVPDDVPLAITTKHLATITVNRKLAEPEFVAQAIRRHPALLGQIQQANRGRSN